MIPLSHYLILGAILFALSVVGIFLNRKNLVILLMAILGVAVSFTLSAFGGLPDVLAGHHFNGTVYAWGVSGGIPLEVGFLIDPLTVLMMIVVTFVSLMVHVYTIGYMHDDPGYQR